VRTEKQTDIGKLIGWLLLLRLNALKPAKCTLEGALQGGSFHLTTSVYRALSLNAVHIID
jgi:hypothetical protein